MKVTRTTPDRSTAKSGATPQTDTNGTNYKAEPIDRKAGAEGVKNKSGWLSAARLRYKVSTGQGMDTLAVTLINRSACPVSWTVHCSTMCAKHTTRGDRACSTRARTLDLSAGSRFATIGVAKEDEARGFNEPPW